VPVFFVALFVEAATVFGVLGATGASEGGVVVHASRANRRNVPAILKHVDLLGAVLGGAYLDA